MEFIKAFIAGFLATLTFHQGLLAALHIAGISPKAAFDMTPAGPLNIPSVISLAFWGGVWGIALWLMIRSSVGADYWMLAALLGAIGPSIVALFIVFPLKGLPMAGGWDPKIIVGALMLNAAWGVGVALFMSLAATLTAE